MQVLKKGTGQQGWARKEICTGSGNGGQGCGAELLVEEGDIYRTSSSSYDGSSEHYKTFTCSECGVETDMKNVPYSVGDRARPARKPKGTAPTARRNANDGHLE